MPVCFRASRIFLFILFLSTALPSFLLAATACAGLSLFKKNIKPILDDNFFPWVFTLEKSFFKILLDRNFMSSFFSSICQDPAPAAGFRAH